MKDIGKANTFSEDKDKNPIDPHEEFRRTKRNSLFWSSITILTIAAMPDHYLAKFHLGLAKLDLESYWIWTGLLLTSSFMFAGFERARRYLRIRHSPTLFQTKASDAVAKIKEVIENLEATTEMSARVKEQSSNLIRTLEIGAQQIETIRTDLKNRVLKDQSEYEKQLDDPGDGRDSFHRVIAEASESSDGKLDTNIWKLIDGERRRRSLAGFRHGHFQALQADQIKERIDSFLAERSNYEPQPLDGKLESSIQTLGQLSSDLSKFHEDIDGADKAWHIGHDRVPVYVLFGFALVMLSFQAAQFAQNRQLDPKAFSVSQIEDVHGSQASINSVPNDRPAQTQPAPRR